MAIRRDINDPLKSVVVTEGFLGAILERTRDATLPHLFDQLEAEGYLRNIDIASGRADDEYSGSSDRDSDLFKVIEGACYCQSIWPSPALENKLDSLIERLAAAQEPDGYLQTYFSSQAPEERYSDFHRSHELYCFGHLFEAGVAHLEATGKTTLLDMAKRLADHVDATFGTGKIEIAPGHQEIELALFRLYHATGEERYRDLARYFVDMRGNKAMVERDYGGKPIIENDRTPGRNRPPEYRQHHLPAVEQREATGHAVRAGYLYTAMADIALESGSDDYAKACNAIWDNIVGKKLYLTGGVGTHQYHDEGFGDDYVLPNTGYCETCGGIAFLLFSQRLGLLTGDAKYSDIVELVFYNHLLSSTDHSGCLTFYRNPLSSQEPRKRHPWNNPACCPTNVIRIVPQMLRWLYATDGKAIYIDHFTSNRAEVDLDHGPVSIRQTTNYPWDGIISITVSPDTAHAFPIHIRVPGWVGGHPVPSDLYIAEASEDIGITVNGKMVDTSKRFNGYCVIDRQWEPGDEVVVRLPMPIQRVHAHPNIEADKGRVALMRGPVVYCVEEMDVGRDPADVVLNKRDALTATFRPDFLGGVTVLTNADESFMAVPFHAWNNRTAGKMSVWLHEA